MTITANPVYIAHAIIVEDSDDVFAIKDTADRVNLQINSITQLSRTSGLIPNGFFVDVGCFINPRDEAIARAHVRAAFQNWYNGSQIRDSAEGPS